jgi:hypothetical protein
MVQQLDSIIHATTRASDSPPAPHLQQLQESSDFLWLVLLVLGSQMQQQQEEEGAQQQAQQQQHAAAALLGSSAHQLWQQQHFWQQHSSADDLSRTLHVLQHLLQYWRWQQERRPRRQEWEVLPDLAGPGLQLLQHLPVQLLQLVSMKWVGSDVGGAGPASNAGQHLLGHAALDMFELALGAALPCANQWDVLEAVLQQWTLLWQQLLPDSRDSSSSSSRVGAGRAPAGTSSASSGASASGVSGSQTHSAPAAGAPVGSGAVAGSLELLLPELPDPLSCILNHVAYELQVFLEDHGSNSSSSTTTTSSSSTTTLPNNAAAHGGGSSSTSNSSSSSSTTTTPAAAADPTTSSSSSQRVSFALQATAAAERCARALAATGSAAAPLVKNLHKLADCIATIHEGAVSWVQGVLLPTSSSEAEHALQLLHEAQLPAVCSIIKAMPINRSAHWAGAEGAQKLLDSMYQDCKDDDDVAWACRELSSRVGSGGSSSSSADRRLTGALSALVLHARWLRVRALQLQFAFNMEPLGSLMQQAESGVADNIDTVSLRGYINNMHGPVRFVADAANDAAKHLSTIINSCRDAEGVPSASSNTASSDMASSSSSSSNAAVPLQALQQLQLRMQDLHRCADSAHSGLEAAWEVSCAVAGCSWVLKPSAYLDAVEYESRHAEFSTASSSAELSQMLRRYGALWQLPGCALLLSEQLLAGLPCDWCCNNPGCVNTAGPSERALVGGKSCKCAGCRTARWVLVLLSLLS